MSDYISEKIEQYERKLKQAEKGGKHNKAKKYQEKLERLRAEAAEASTDSDTDSDDDDIDSDDEADNSFALDESMIPCADFPGRPRGPCATSNCARPFSATDRTPATTADASSYNLERSRRVREAYRKAVAGTRV